MGKLISMTDFVLEQEKHRHRQPITESKLTSYDKIVKYANFLKQPLKLEMFVPCDEDGNVLEEDLFKNNPNISTLKPYERVVLEKAEENVLFDGFFNTGDYITNGDLQIDDEFIEGKTIEDLVPYNLTLIKNAIDKHEL